MAKKTPFDLPRTTQRFLTVVALQGLAAAAWLLLIPKEAGNAVLLGFSLRRLALLLPLLGTAGLALLLAGILKKNSKWQAILENAKRRAVFGKAGLWLGFLMAALAWSLAFFFHFMRFMNDMGAYMRLLPALVYFLLIGIELMLVISFTWLGGKGGRRLQLKGLIGPNFMIALSVLAVVWLTIELSGLGKQPEFVSINSLGVPLLESQVWYAAGMIALALCFAAGWARLPGASESLAGKKVDVLIFFGLALLAALLWLSLPLPRHNYFAPQVLPPNDAKYPFSDAEQYDMNSLWVWKGSIKDTVISKPLYVIFLSILHALSGYDYSRLIFLQTLVLALLPAVFYLIGKELHSRLGGLALGLLVILREVNAILATDFANVSNSKLLLSDLPSTLLVGVLLLVLIRWFKSDPQKTDARPFILGGIVGCLNLMRIQTLLLVPFLLLLIFLRYRKFSRHMLLAVGLFLLALALILTPVLARNHAITGVYWIDNPTNSSALYRFFIDASDYELDVPEAVTQEEMLQRNISVIAQVVSQNLGKILLLVADNFFHNILSTFLLLPVRLGNGVSLLDFFQIRQPFWDQVYSLPNFWNMLVVAVNLMLIALGASRVLSRNRNGLWLVVSFYAVYNLSSALVRLSGWRFIQPVDWLAYAFFAFGLVEVLRWLFSRLLGDRGFEEYSWLCGNARTVIQTAMKWKTLAFYASLFLVIGAFIPLREALFPAAFPEYSQVQVCATMQDALIQSGLEEKSEDLLEFCLREDVRAFGGLGVYPRFFKEGSGFYKRTYDPYFGKQDYSRLVFRTVGQPNAKVYIKTDESDLRFPDGVEVLVVGEDKAKFEASLVLIGTEEAQLLISSELLSAWKN